MLYLFFVVLLFCFILNEIVLNFTVTEGFGVFFSEFKNILPRSLNDVRYSIHVMRFLIKLLISY